MFVTRKGSEGHGCGVMEILSRQILPDGTEGYQGNLQNSWCLPEIRTGPYPKAGTEDAVTVSYISYIRPVNISSTRAACGLSDTKQVQTFVTATVCHCAVSSPSPAATLQSLLTQDTRLLRTCTVPVNSPSAYQQYHVLISAYYKNACGPTVRVDIYGVLCSWVAR